MVLNVEVWDRSRTKAGDSFLYSGGHAARAGKERPERHEVTLIGVYIDCRKGQAAGNAGALVNPRGGDGDRRRVRQRDSTRKIPARCAISGSTAPWPGLVPAIHVFVGVRSAACGISLRATSAGYMTSGRLRGRRCQGGEKSRESTPPMGTFHSTGPATAGGDNRYRLHFSISDAEGHQPVYPSPVRRDAGR